jgi:lipid-binding SYLF domain-containing protein
MLRAFSCLTVLASIVTQLVWVAPASAASGSALDQDVAAALQSLYFSTPAARALGAKAKGVLVFPSVIKAGFIVGAQRGEGALLQNGKTAGYYSTSALSAGLQAGAQSFGYALFFMSDAALKYLANANGWEIGVGPSIVIVDSGMARSFSTTTAHADIYAFFFDQKGLMAGAGLQGAKITALER